MIFEQEYPGVNTKLQQDTVIIVIRDNDTLGPCRITRESMVVAIICLNLVVFMLYDDASLNVIITYLQWVKPTTRVRVELVTIILQYQDYNSCLNTVVSLILFLLV